MGRLDSFQPGARLVLTSYGHGDVIAPDHHVLSEADSTHSDERQARCCCPPILFWCSSMHKVPWPSGSPRSCLRRSRARPRSPVASKQDGPERPNDCLHVRKRRCVQRYAGDPVRLRPVDASGRRNVWHVGLPESASMLPSRTARSGCSRPRIRQYGGMAADGFRRRCRTIGSASQTEAST